MQYASINKKYYGGVDLHGDTILVCVENKEGNVMLHKEAPSNGKAFLSLIKQYAGNIAICAESTFNWYWLADVCHANNIPFFLGHALYMKHIHGGKTKDDHIDSKKMADLLRTGFFPLAYAYPKEMRETRDLNRRRIKFVNERAALARHIKVLLYQQGHCDFPANLVKGKDIRERVLTYKVSPEVAISIEYNLELMDKLDEIIGKIDWQTKKAARHLDSHSIAILDTLQGCGDVVGKIILYETHTIDRFKTPQRYSSFCRVVNINRSSAGKRLAPKNVKIGNPYLRWAFGHLATNAQRFYPEIKILTDKLIRKLGPRRAYAYLAHKFAVAVYYMLKNKEPFDVTRFVHA
jgi:transposase